MKTFKSLTVVLGLVFAVSLTSCQKDQDPMGVYSPKKKIQSLYVSTPQMGKRPFQSWEWNENQLKSITHYYHSGTEYAWMEFFTYDKDNRLTRVDDYTNSNYITYDYEGDNLKSATVFYKNAIVATWAMEYDNNKISKLTGNIYDNYFHKASGEALHLNPLAHLLPPCLYEKVAQCEQKMAEQRHTNDTYSIVYLLTWTEQNITKLIMTGEGELLSFDLKYDDKNNPQSGFQGTTEDYYTDFLYGHIDFCKNNVTMLVATEGLEDYTDTIRYAYQYDSDNYPILQTMYNTEDEDNKTVLYFVY